MMKRFYLIILALSIFFSAGLSVNAQQITKKQIDQARKLFQEGEKLYNQKKYRLAIVKYDQSIAIVPKNPMANYKKASAHYELKENDLALSAYTKALNEGFQTPYDIYKIRWYLFSERKEFDSAKDDLEAALKIKPNEGYLWMAAGDVYSQKNMDQEAINAYQKAIELKQPNNNLYYLIAYSYSKLGDFTKQSEAAINAIKNGTIYVGESWFLAGQGFQRARRFSDAAASYERSIQSKPELADSFINLSQVYQIMNRLNDSVSIAKKGVEYHPNNGLLYTNLSWYYSLTDQHELAVEAGKKAVSLLPQEPMGYANLCRAYNDLKQYNSAVEACGNGLKLSPNDGETNFYMARALDFLKRSDAATPHYNKAVKGLIDFTKNNPDYSDGFYLLGNAYYAVGKRNEAISAYKQSLALSPQFTKAIYNLGFMYVLNNDKNAARLQYNELLKLDKELAGKLLQAIQGK